MSAMITGKATAVISSSPPTSGAPPAKAARSSSRARSVTPTSLIAVEARAAEAGGVGGGGRRLLAALPGPSPGYGDAPAPRGTGPNVPASVRSGSVGRPPPPPPPPPPAGWAARVAPLPQAPRRRDAPAHRGAPGRVLGDRDGAHRPRGPEPAARLMAPAHAQVDRPGGDPAAGPRGDLLAPPRRVRPFRAPRARDARPGTLRWATDRCSPTTRATASAPASSPTPRASPGWA